jgi:sugar phosphate isomerase/epimerase
MNRRTFIQGSGLLAMSVLLSKFTNAVTPSRLKFEPGIQLYMVRDEMAKDAAGTLNKLGKMGYKQLESFGGDKGMFWGMSNRDFQKLAGDNGLTLVSSHYNDEPGGFEKQAEKAAEIGMKYLICPWKGPQKSIDKFKVFANEFNRNGEICKKHGMRFGYHPHDYPYKKVDGQLPIDVLLANTDKHLVDFEMDFYYTVTEGQDPEAYIKKYSNRFKLCHMRDVLKKRLPPGSNEESACDLGQGIINYPHLLQTGYDNGMRYFFVEQSRFFHETPLQSAQVNIDYLKQLLRS